MGALMATHAIGYLTGIGTTEPGAMRSYDAFPPSMRTYRVAADPERQLTPELHDSCGEVCAVVPQAQTMLDAARRGDDVAGDISDRHGARLADPPAGRPARNLRLSTIDSEQDVADRFRALQGEQQVLVYCAAGQRSEQFVERYAPLAERSGMTLASLPGGVNGR